MDLSDLLCQLCGVQYKTDENFRLHMIRHTSEPKLPCDQCGKLFYTPHSLEIHRKMHFTIKPVPKMVVCKICLDGEQRFTTPHLLNNHILKMHSNAEPDIQCRYCDRKFLLRVQLARHVKSAHYLETGNIKKCDQCDKVVSSNLRLRLHIKTIHEGLRFHCPACSATFSFKHKMYSHIDKTHSSDAIKVRELGSKVELK